jgi:WD40 repeat protein
VSAAVEHDSPYVGLVPFSEEDADFFFGRTRDVAVIVANVFASPLTVLYGPSGVGKTSVLQAGVFPSLRERGLAPILLRSWAGEATETLRRAAPDAPPGSGGETRREVLLLDEFEDFFHETEDTAFAAELARVVTRPARTSSVLLAIREDALAKLDRFEGRIPGLLDNVLRLEHHNRESAREAILGPRDRWNELAYPSERFEVEEALVEAVLDGVPAGPGRVETLLLQLVMTRLWEARGPRGPYVLRRETFHALGGVDGIVREYVNEKLEALDPPRQEQAAEILEHLVTPSRLRLAQRTSDLAGFAGVTERELRPLLTELSESRILRPVAGSDVTDSRYEVHHDSLADAVLAWRTHYVTEHELAAQRRRFRRRLALVLVGSALLAVLAAVATYAWTQRQTARSEELSAEAVGLLAIDPDAAVETALDAVDTKAIDPAENALRATVARSHGRGVIGGTDDAIADVDVAPDGRLLTTSTDGTLTLRSPAGEAIRTYQRLPPVQDAALCPGANRVVASVGNGVVVVTRGLRARLPGAPESALLVECSSNGAAMLVANEDVVRVYSRGGRPLMRVDAEELGFVEDAALSGNGELLAVAGPEETRVIRVGSGGTAARIVQPLTSVAFTPDGSRLVGGTRDGQVLIRGLRGPRSRIVLDGHTQPVSDVEVSGDGTLLVSAGTDRVARVWDAVTGAEIAVLRGHERALRSAGFGAGQTIVTGADDGTARFWEAPVTSVLAGHTGPIVALAVTPDGARVATASSEEGAVRVWNARTGAELARIIATDVASVAISANGRRLLTRQTIDGRVRLWDVSKPRRHVLIPVAEPSSATFTPDGRLVATAGPGRTIRFFNLAGRQVRSFGAPSRLDEAGSLTFTRQADRLAVAEVPEGQAVILHARTGSELAALPEQALRVLALAFSREGDSLATAEADGVARLWHTGDGSARPPALAGHDGAVLSASFSPDSTLVATAGNDDTVRIWHVETGVELLRVPGSSTAFAGRAPVLVTGGPGTTAHVLPCNACGSVSELRERATSRPGG